MGERAVQSRMGQQLGHYRLVRLLGKGGFAEVYLGEHIHLGTQAAVKVLHTQLAQEEDIESFRQEARTIARLVHPHIIRVLDFGVEAGTPFLVMDYASQGTLKQRHPRGTRLTVPLVVQYAKQVAEALQWAHDARLIHRDVKPENMLIGHRQEILLSDFGIALAAQSSLYQNTQNVAGTIAYMAPEQIQAHPRPASDQYALGIVVYEWLSGNRPFNGTMTEIAVKHSTMPPPPLRQQVPALSSALEEVVMIALNKDPHRRFPTVLAFAQALEGAGGQAQGTQTMATSFWMSGSFQTQPTPMTSRPPILQQPPLPPQPPMPPAMSQSPSYSASNFSTSMPAQQRPQRAVSRRVMLAGVLGAAAVGGGIGGWMALTQFLHSAESKTGGTLFYPTTGSSPITQTYTPGAQSSPQKPLLSYGGQTDYIWTLDWSPDGKYIASGSLDGTVHIWDAGTAARLLSYRSHIQPAVSNDIPWDVDWAPTGERLLIAFTDGRAELVDVPSRSLSKTYTANTPAPVKACGWSPNGLWLALGSTDDSVRVYEVASGRLLTTYSEHSDFILTLDWSPDSTRIVSGSSDGTARVWRASDGKTLLNYTNHKSDVKEVAWSHDGTRIASASSDGTAQVWDAQSGHTQVVYTKHTGGLVNTIAWAPRDTFLASAGNDIHTHIWDPKTGELRQSIFSYAVFSVAWRPDGKRVVTASSNKTADVWPVLV